MAPLDTASLPPPGSPPPSIAPGEFFAGRFELRALLGRGGMGEVWSARDRVLAREVALKIFPAAGIGGRATERIRREVTVARDLAHPHLVRYYDIHEDGGRLGLSMERVCGRTLQEALASDGPLPEERLRPVLAALAEALAHLHAHGVVHRDIKPSNIFLATDGTVKLGDFGIVHIEEEEGLTRTGETLGTPTHMAPEQFLGEPPAPAADWYALGIVVHEMVTGQPPFVGTYGTIAAGHMDRPAPVLPRGAASRPLRRLAEGLLLKAPRRRWGAAAVERYAAGRTLPLLPRHRRAAAAAGGALLLAAAGWAGGRHILHPPPTAIQVERESVRAYADDRLAWERVVPGLSDALLVDVDGDGDREVVLGGKVEPGIAKQPLILEVLDGRGRPAPPLFLGRVLGRDFPGFDRNFQTVFQSAGGGRFAAYIHHYWFYPTYAFLWDASLGRVVFNVSHSGRFYRAFPFHGGAAFEGFNNRLLHQRVLLVTGPLDGSPTGAQIVDDVNQFAFRNLRAYHLLGDGDAVLFDGPDRVRVRLSEGGERTVTPEGDIEGAPGSGAESLALLMEYRRIRDLLLQGDGAAARPRAGLARERAVLAGLAGHGALFAALEAEADAVAGDFRRASETARERAGHFPGCDQDLLIKAALYALIDGDALRAGELLEGVSAEGLGSRRDEVRTLVVWAALLRSPREGRATLHLQQTLLGSGPYWGPYMAFQEGWAALLEGDAAAARAVLAPALRAEGMEHHAAGHFLALIAEGAFDAEAFDAYLASAGVHPAYLEWVGAVGKGEAKAAERHRALLEADAVHAPDSALMLALMNRVPTVYPVLR